MTKKSGLVKKFTWSEGDIVFGNNKSTFIGKRILKGGPGSGHHGHVGRPGQRGGSAAGISATFDPTTASRVDLENKGYIPVYRGTGAKGLESIRPSSSGQLGPGIYFYGDPINARSYAEPGGGVITGFVHPDSVKIEEVAASTFSGAHKLIVLKNPEEFVRRGTVVAEDTRITGYGAKAAKAFEAKFDVALEEIISKNKSTFTGKRMLKGGPGSGHHGHAGRPGQRGGSSSGTGGGMAGGSFPSGPDVTYSVVNELFLDGSWNNPGVQRRADLKDSIATDLSASSDATYDEASSTMAQWAHSSNDNDMRSLAIQQAAAKEFGVPVSDFVKKRAAEVSAQKVHEVEAMGKPLMAEDRQRVVLRAMYDSTQQRLQTTFGPDDTIRLRRGVSFQDSKGWSKGDAVDIVGNPMESWSFSSNVARDFADTQVSEFTGYVLEMDVPVKNIVSTAVTGAGALIEGEFIVIGSIPGSARVLDVIKTEGL